MDAIEIKHKKFIVIPRDAFNVLVDRYAAFADAGEAAKERCADDGQQMYVVELKAIAAKDAPPVHLRKLK